MQGRPYLRFLYVENAAGDRPIITAQDGSAFEDKYPIRPYGRLGQLGFVVDDNTNHYEASYMVYMATVIENAYELDDAKANAKPILQLMDIENDRVYASNKTTTGADILFIVDSSGSMTQDMARLKAAIPGLFHALDAAGCTDVRVGLMVYTTAYKQHKVGSSLWATYSGAAVSMFSGLAIWNSSSAQAASAIRWGLKNYKFLDTASKKYIVLVTDTGREGDPITPPDVLPDLRSQGIILNVIAKDDSYYGDTARATGGQFIDTTGLTDWTDILTNTLGGSLIGGILDTTPTIWSVQMHPDDPTQYLLPAQAAGIGHMVYDDYHKTLWYVQSNGVFLKVATMSGFALEGHNHDDRYAMKDHNHDDTYLRKDHNHDDRYAMKDHNHDDRYAMKGHTHSEFDIILNKNEHYIEVTAGENLVACDLVSINSNGLAVKAKADGNQGAGFVCEDATRGNKVKIQVSGIFYSYALSSLTPGVTYYQGDDGGLEIKTPDLSYRVALALTRDTILILHDTTPVDNINFIKAVAAEDINADELVCMKSDGTLIKADRDGDKAVGFATQPGRVGDTIRVQVAGIYNTVRSFYSLVPGQVYYQHKSGIIRLLGDNPYVDDTKPPTHPAALALSKTSFLILTEIAAGTGSGSGSGGVEISGVNVVRKEDLIEGTSSSMERITSLDDQMSAIYETPNWRLSPYMVKQVLMVENPDPIVSLSIELSQAETGPRIGEIVPPGTSLFIPIYSSEWTLWCYGSYKVSVLTETISSMLASHVVSDPATLPTGYEAYEYTDPADGTKKYVVLGQIKNFEVHDDGSGLLFDYPQWIDDNIGSEDFMLIGSLTLKNNTPDEEETVEIYKGVDLIQTMTLMAGAEQVLDVQREDIRFVATNPGNVSATANLHVTAYSFKQEV